MRLHVLSDLHLEFGDWTPERTDADVVILAGDIHQGTKGIEWARRHFPKQPVIYVMGNHEFYGCVLDSLLEAFRTEVRGSNIHLLENESVEIEGITFLGCTLWTDFKLWPEPAEAMAAAKDSMNDFRLIRTRSSRLRPADTVRRHRTSVVWLHGQLEKNVAERTVIVTHHAPSEKSIPARYVGDVLTPAFASRLDALVRQSRVPLWIHGHTHHCVDYKIGGTRVFSNQKGYPGDTDLGFLYDAIVEV